MKDLKFYLNKALKNHFALGAFNFCNMESLQAIVSASLKTKSPAIISVSESALSYMGEDFVMALAKTAKKQNPALFLHLDHGKSYEICKKAVDLGFDSVMIDASALDFKENIKLTKRSLFMLIKKTCWLKAKSVKSKAWKTMSKPTKTSIPLHKRLASLLVKQVLTCWLLQLEQAMASTNTAKIQL